VQEPPTVNNIRLSVHTRVKCQYEKHEHNHVELLRLKCCDCVLNAGFVSTTTMLDIFCPISHNASKLNNNKH